MLKVLCSLTIAASLWSFPASAFFAFEMPRLTFPSDQQSAEQVTRGAGTVVTPVPLAK